MLSELIEIRNRIDALIAAQQTQESSTTKKVYTRSDNELWDALHEVDSSIMDIGTFCDVVGNLDFMVVN